MEEEEEPYPTRRRTRSTTNTPAKNAQVAPPIAKVSTTMFYGPSPKKPTAAVSASSQKTSKKAESSKKAGLSSRIDDMMRDLSSDSDVGELPPLKPKPKGKEKTRSPPKKAVSTLAQTDDEGFQTDRDARDPELVRKRREGLSVTRIGPPKGKTKKGPIATSTPKRALPRREEEDSFMGPSPNRIVEVEIESQPQHPVAGPSRMGGSLVAAASEMTASPSRGRPNKKRTRSPTPPPPPAANKRKSAKSVTPSSVELEENGQQQQRPSAATTITNLDLSAVVTGRPAAESRGRRRCLRRKS